jgi:hypothetical protein
MVGAPEGGVPKLPLGGGAPNPLAEGTPNAAPEPPDEGGEVDGGAAGGGALNADAPGGGDRGPRIVAWKPRSCCLAAGDSGGAGLAAPDAGAAGDGAPGRTGGVTPDIIMVPLNFEGAARVAAAFNSVPHATHVLASSVFGLPQFGQ